MGGCNMVLSRGGSVVDPVDEEDEEVKEDEEGKEDVAFTDDNTVEVGNDEVVALLA